MISDLEILGALEKKDDLAQFLSGLEERGGSSSLKARVFSRIDSEKPRVTTDTEGRIVSINPAFSLLCGYSFDELRGKKPGEMLQGEKTDPNAVNVIRQAVRLGWDCVTELVNYHKDGTPYTVRLEIQPLRDAAGQLKGFQAVETRLK